MGSSIEAEAQAITNSFYCHVVAMPYPGRGHINPVMNFCKHLTSSHKDILVTFVVTEEWLGLLSSEPKPDDNIRFRTIPNVVPSEHVRAADMKTFFGAVMTNMEAPFEDLLDRLETPPHVIISDTFLFWAIGVGKRRGIPVASFWSMSASMFSNLLHFDLFSRNGHFPVNLTENGEDRVDYIPGISPTRLGDFSHFMDKENDVTLERILHTFSWVDKAQYLFLPTIYDLESSVIDALKEKFSLPIYCIGPLIPHFGFDQSQSNTHNYMSWLDNQPAGSVLYVSQGSFLSFSSDQTDEIAHGLSASGVKFLWVGRGEASRFKEILGDNGLVVSWCDQMRVLLHPSIGGFWSHCGWNSTREGVFAGISFLTCPISMDQMLNSKVIVEDWKIGWRVRKGVVGADNLVRRDEIAGLVKKFMDAESDEVKGMRRRARELQKISQLAFENGGSFQTNVNEFVKNIKQGHGK